MQNKVYAHCKKQGKQKKKNNNNKITSTLLIQLLVWRVFCLFLPPEKGIKIKIGFSSVQSLSRVPLLATPWTAACQASPSITNSWSLLKLMFTDSVMPSNHLILFHPLLLPPSIFPSIRVFSSQSVLRIRWPLFLRGNYYLHSLFYPLLNTEIVKYTLHWTLGIHDSLSLKRLTIHGRRQKQMFINTKLVSKHNELNLTVGIMTLITLEFLDFSEIPAKCRAGAVLLLPQLKNEC